MNCIGLFFLGVAAGALIHWLYADQEGLCLHTKDAPSPLDLMIDPERERKYDVVSTGVYVRAQGVDGRWRSIDMLWLTKASFLCFLKSRGGDNPWAEDVCGILLSYGHLHPLPSEN